MIIKTMTGLRCPNCGFYNLSARAKCARCGKALPQIPRDQKDAIPFDEATGSDSLLKEDIISQTGVPPKAPEPPKKSTLLQDAEKAKQTKLAWEVEISDKSEAGKPAQTPRPASEPIPASTPAEPVPKPSTPEPIPETELTVTAEQTGPTKSAPILEPEIIPESGDSSRGAVSQEPASLEPSPDTKSALEEIPEKGIESKVGSVITGEVILEQSQSRTEKVAAMQTEAEPKPIEPELPSFDESAASKVEPAADLGELSSFWKESRKKGKTLEEELKEEPAEEASEIKFKEGFEQAEASLSQIGLSKEEPSGPSFKPDFEKPLFPQFGAESGDKSTYESSESAVSSPSYPGKARIIFAGLIDLIIYIVIYSLFFLASEWAGGVSVSDLKPSEMLLRFGVPVLATVLVAVWFYQLFFIAVLSQTLGGMAMKLEVLDQTGKKPRVLKASLRAFIYVLCLIPLGFGFIPTVLGKSLPDKLARTKSVRW